MLIPTPMIHFTLPLESPTGPDPRLPHEAVPTMWSKAGHPYSGELLGHFCDPVEAAAACAMRSAYGDLKSWASPIRSSGLEVFFGDKLIGRFTQDNAWFVDFFTRWRIRHYQYVAPRRWHFEAF